MLSVRRQKTPKNKKTIKIFEITGLILFMQLLLFWQTLDDLTRLYDLTKVPTQGKNAPTSIEQVLKRY